MYLNMSTKQLLLLGTLSIKPRHISSLSKFNFSHIWNVTLPSLCFWIVSCTDH